MSTRIIFEFRKFELMLDISQIIWPKFPGGPDLAQDPDNVAENLRAVLHGGSGFFHDFPWFQYKGVLGEIEFINLWHVRRIKVKRG